MGDWPQIEVQSSEPSFAVSILRGSQSFHLSFSDIGRSKILDLNSNPALKDVYGSINLRFSCFSSSGSEIVSKSLVRLPAWKTEYVEDQQRRPTKAVLISELAEGSEILAFEQCQVERPNLSSFLVSAIDPLKHPIALLEWIAPDSEKSAFQYLPSSKQGGHPRTREEAA